MSSSLRDQLLKAGLVSKKQPTQSKRKPKTQRRKEKSAEQKQRDEELRALAEHKRARDRELNAQRNQQLKAQEQADWVRQVAARHQVDKKPAADGDAAFHFEIDGKIHHLYLAAEQRQQLSRGKLGILWFDGKYHVLPADEAKRILERLQRRVWLAPDSDEGQSKDSDDPYAQYQVPDDLMW